MLPVVGKKYMKQTLNIVTPIYRRKLLHLHLLHPKYFKMSEILIKVSTVWVSMDHGEGGGAFGTAEHRYARKLVIISVFRKLMVIQTKK